MDHHNIPEPEPAYAVPFVVERETARGMYRLINVGHEAIHGVALTLHGAGLMAANAPARLESLEVLEVSVAGRDLARNSIMVVRWFRPDGIEYLWRVNF